MVGQVGVADKGSDGDAALGGGGDFAEGEVVDIDKGGGELDAVLHEINEVGSAG